MDTKIKLCIIIPIIILFLIILLFVLYINKIIGFKNYSQEDYEIEKEKIINSKYLNDLSQNHKTLQEIPKQIYMTYHKKNIPEKVFTNLKKYATYDNEPIPCTIFNDDDAIKFLSKYYNKSVIDKFKSLSGAHKADLFRYCLLYIKGGIYMDIKTELIKPLIEVIDLDKKNTFYSVYGHKFFGKRQQIYQGIIITPPRNEIIFKLIVDVIETPTFITKLNYLIFTQQFYKIANDHTDSELKPGFNKLKDHLDLYIFQEILEETCEKPDRYGVCANIYDQDNKIIKTRFDDYPW